MEGQAGHHAGRQGPRPPDRHRPDRAVLPRGRLHRRRPAQRPGQRSAEQLKTWDDFLAAGVELKAKSNPKASIVADAVDLYGTIVNQGTARYIDKDNKFIGDQDHIRKAWDTAVKAITLKVDGRTLGGSPDWNAGLDQGTCPTVVGAAWVALDIKAACKTSVGKWRVAPTPSGPANFGGSFLAITKNAADPAGRASR